MVDYLKRKRQTVNDKQDHGAMNYQSQKALKVESFSYVVTSELYS